MIAQNPFVGAVSYGERQWRHFRGRDSEVLALIGEIEEWQLTVLTGGSASGKSSLVHAGLIPQLRKQRQTLLKHAPQSCVDAGYPYPVLAFRSWGKLSSDGSLREFLWRNIDDMVETLRPSEEEWDNELKSPVDYKVATAVLNRVKEAQSQGAIDTDNLFVAGLNGFAQKFGGVIVVLDQLEELTRSTGHHAAEIVSLVRELYRLNTQVRILLSLREEHLSVLRRLDDEVGSIMKRGFFIRPILGDIAGTSESAADLILRKSFQAEGYTLSDSLRQTLIKKCMEVVDSVGGKGFLPLFQVVCREFFEWLTSSKDAGAYDLAALQNYESHIRSHHYGPLEAAEDGSQDPVYRRALERWIEQVMRPKPPSPVDDSVIVNRGRSRWYVARAAKHLFSGDFKIAVDVRELWKKIEPASHIGIRQGNISGLEEEFRDVLHELDEREILTLYQSTDENKETQRVELRHDILGPALGGWAAGVVDSLEDSLASPVFNIGIDVTLDASISRIPAPFWSDCAYYRGCSFLAPPNTIEALGRADCWKSLLPAALPTFEGHTFKAWTFRGSYFVGVQFRNCCFMDCDLQGALFVCCNFEDVEFRGLHGLKSQMDLRGCRFNNVQLRDCDVQQISLYREMDYNEMASELVSPGRCKAIEQQGAIQLMENTVIRLGRFEGLVGDGSITADRNSKFSYCLWDEQSAQRIKATSATQIASCGEISQTRSGRKAVVADA